MPYGWSFWCTRSQHTQLSLLLQCKAPRCLRNHFGVPLDLPFFFSSSSSLFFFFFLFFFFPFLPHRSLPKAADEKKLGRAKLLSMSSGSSASSDDGEAHSDGNTASKKKKVATKKRGKGAGKAKVAGKKPAGKKRNGSSSSASSASSSSSVVAKAYSKKQHATAPAMPVDSLLHDTQTDTEMDPWVALQSTGDAHDDMFYPGQHDGGSGSQQPPHVRGGGGGGGSRDGAEVDAWESELLSFNSGHFDGFSPDADYSRMLATGAGATPDNAGWLPTTYLPGVQHSASPMPGGISAARHQPQHNEMLVLG